MAVARAILDAVDEDNIYVGDSEDLTSVTVDGHVDFVSIARAAIEAMRKPTEAMVWAGVTADTGPTLGTRASNSFDAMIAAALAEGDEKGTGE